MSLTLITINIFDRTKLKTCCDYIKENEHIELSESTFIIKTSLALEMLRRELSEYFDKTDTLFATKIPDSKWISFHLGGKRKWIEENV